MTEVGNIKYEFGTRYGYSFHFVERKMAMIRFSIEISISYNQNAFDTIVSFSQ